MLIKPGAMPLYNEIVNTWDPKDLKFTFEWIGRMELEIENGNLVAAVAKDTLVETAGESDKRYNLDELVQAVRGIWKYGEELYEWKTKKVTAKKKGNKISQIYLSKHARKRMHERCGFNRKAQDKMAVVAYQKGLKTEDTKGVTRSYLSKVLHNTEEDEAMVRLYGDKVYVYKMADNGIVLITVMQIPRLYIKCIKEECLI